MIQRLYIENFQSIEKLDLDFGKYTVLVGKSNSGKSAILRALHALVRNSFIPAYLRKGTKTTKITTTYDNGEVVTKRGSEATYELTQGTNHEVYTKSGRAIPADVLDFLAMPLLAEEDLNFTNQFELPFLVAGKSSRASAVVGTITNAVTTQELAQEANRLRLATLSKIKVREGDLEALRSDAGAFDDLPALEQALDYVRTLESELVTSQQTAASIKQLVGWLNDTEGAFVAVPKAPELDESWFDTLVELNTTKRGLTSLITQISNISTVPVPQAPDIDPTIFDSVDDLQHQQDRLLKLLSNISKAKHTLTECTHQLHTITGQVDSIKVELETMAVCESCGQPLP